MRLQQVTDEKEVKACLPWSAPHTASTSLGIRGQHGTRGTGKTGFCLSVWRLIDLYYIIIRDSAKIRDWIWCWKSGALKDRGFIHKEWTPRVLVFSYLFCEAHLGFYLFLEDSLLLPALPSSLLSESLLHLHSVLCHSTLHYMLPFTAFSFKCISTYKVNSLRRRNRAHISASHDLWLGANT